jgi:energy-coupling factor transporter ATP-binding protein EcfA2
MYANETLGEARATATAFVNEECAVASIRNPPLADFSAARERLNALDFEESELGAVASLRLEEGPRAVIGIAGHKGSGKDTFAKVVTQVLGEDNVAVVKFADCLKDMLRTMLRYAGVDAATIEECFEGDLKEAPAPPLNGATPRHAMTTLGTEWGRELIDQNIWTELTKRHIQTSREYDGKVVLITDVRFHNEARAVKEMGGELVRVDRTGQEPDLSHPSEQHIPDLPALEVFTNGDLTNFRLNVAGWAWQRFLQK